MSIEQDQEEYFWHQCCRKWAWWRTTALWVTARACPPSPARWLTTALGLTAQTSPPSPCHHPKHLQHKLPGQGLHQGLQHWRVLHLHHVLGAEVTISITYNRQKNIRNRYDTNWDSGDRRRRKKARFWEGNNQERRRKRRGSRKRWWWARINSTRAQVSYRKKRIIWVKIIITITRIKIISITEPEEIARWARRIGSSSPVLEGCLPAELRAGSVPGVRIGFGSFTIIIKCQGVFGSNNMNIDSLSEKEVQLGAMFWFNKAQLNHSFKWQGWIIKFLIMLASHYSTQSTSGLAKDGSLFNRRSALPLVRRTESLW